MIASKIAGIKGKTEYSAQFLHQTEHKFITQERHTREDVSDELKRRAEGEEGWNVYRRRRGQKEGAGRVWLGS
ncbi:unnamed protein product [Dovyalis caffra]|uniref:Uncharacterized protein n=1 Tax=Dovyalis caffra TaxID=77055 RepID=A0AAV1R140_9ROSI|nr:unnamed protein product [Dovyalis caffra]